MGIWQQRFMAYEEKSTMNILGIADNHDSGAALIQDGVIVSAINQERIDRTKNSSAFPWGGHRCGTGTRGYARQGYRRHRNGNKLYAQRSAKDDASIPSAAKINGSVLIRTSRIYGIPVYSQTHRIGQNRDGGQPYGIATNPKSKTIRPAQIHLV